MNLPVASGNARFHGNLSNLVDHSDKYRDMGTVFGFWQVATASAILVVSGRDRRWREQTASTDQRHPQETGNYRIKAVVMTMIVVRLLRHSTNSNGCQKPTRSTKLIT